MIKIKDKKDCCGCASCVQACPKQCISFKEDEQGFSYPSVNEKDCIDCGLCEKVCPVLNQNEKRKPLKVYAAINPNEEVRLKSSSGGIFSMIAETVINEGGVVFGARFDENWEVMHDYTETIEGLEVFRGSKYVQSRIGNTYKQTRDFLKVGRKVLYSGTSCQIAGLKKFLRKEYENLLTVDVVCHGVPSPKIWKNYLCYINPKKEIITYINMRNKSRGWSRYSYIIKTKCSVLYDDFASKSLFLQGFTWNLYLRPSCYNCPSKSGRSYSDITLSDNWGAQESSPELYDDKGTSAVLINTENGYDILNNLCLDYKELSFSLFLKYNESYIKSSYLSPYYDLFWKNYFEFGISAVNDIAKIIRPTFLRRIIRKINKFMK